MEIEERLRKLENTISLLRGGAIVGVIAVFAFFGVTSFVQIPSQVTAKINEAIESQVLDDFRRQSEQAIKSIVSQSEAASVNISAAETKAIEFLGTDLRKSWPDGTYAILSNGSCPGGWKTVNTHARSMPIYRRGETWVVPAIFGDSKIAYHGNDTRVDIHLSVCVKEN